MNAYFTAFPWQRRPSPFLGCTSPSSVGDFLPTSAESRPVPASTCHCLGRPAHHLLRLSDLAPSIGPYLQASCSLRLTATLLKHQADLFNPFNTLLSRLTNRRDSWSLMQFRLRRYFDFEYG